MDLEYLLALQDLRLGSLSFLAGPFNAITLFGTGVPFVALFAVLYWLHDKRLSLLGLFSYSCAMFLGQFLKLVFCIYRPWVRDPRIIPDAHALGGATGYSFPSCHSAGITSSLGSIIVTFRRHKALVIASVIAIALCCFSRNFLGVHTPQDIAVGAAMGIVGIILASLLLPWGAQSSRNANIVLAGGLIVGIAAIIFFLVKPYPMDYVDGTLLVDPAIMRKDAIEATGTFLGCYIGWYLDVRFIHYEPVGISKRSIIATVFGFVGAGIILLVLPLAMKPLFGVVVSGFIKFFLTLVFILALWPMAIRRICKPRSNATE